jgi:hypothetical protein
MGFSGENSMMNRCCNVGNLQVSTPDGTVPTSMVVLECKTCGHFEPYVFNEEHDHNVCFAFIQWNDQFRELFPDRNYRSSGLST